VRTWWNIAPLGACCCSLGDSGLPTTHWSQAEPWATEVQCTRFWRCSGFPNSANRSADGVSMFTFTPRADRYSAIALPILLVAPVRNTWDGARRQWKVIACCSHRLMCWERREHRQVTHLTQVLRQCPEDHSCGKGVAVHHTCLKMGHLLDENASTGIEKFRLVEGTQPHNLSARRLTLQDRRPNVVVDALVLALIFTPRAPVHPL
jgi:hypothetical protein